MLKNRLRYRDDLDLVFVRSASGLPLRWAALWREFHHLITVAGVKPITLHGLRHTSATLLLLAGEAAKIVGERLGHKKVATTLDLYSHVLPQMQEAAAAKLGALLFG